MDRQLSEIKNLAFKHSKQELGRMVQMGLIDPQKAMMAGMMRDRISKEDTKPPVTTVAQDLLAPPPEMPPQMPPQMPAGAPQEMGMPPEAPPMAPDQMMAAGGLSSIPVHNIGNFAGGGIIAFDDGGEVEMPNGGYNDNYDANYSGFNDPIGQGVEGFAGGGVPGYAGGPYYGSLVGPQKPESQNQMVRGRGAIAAPVDPAYVQQQLAIIESQISQTPPGRGRASLENQRNELLAQIGQPAITAPPAAPPGGLAAIAPNAVNASGPAPTTFPAPVAPPPPEAPAAPVARPPVGPRVPSTPPLPPIGNAKLGDAKEYKMPAAEDIKGALNMQAEADKLAGVDTSIYDKLSSEFEGKKGKLGERKKEAVGMALMQAGIGLFGAKQGQEFSALSDSGQKALAGLAASNERIREYEDKLEDKQRDLALAKNDYARTKSKSAQDRVQRIEDKRNDLENKTVDATNKRDEAIAAIQVQERGQNVQMRNADLQYKSHMAQIGQMARPGETERLMAQYQALYKQNPTAAAQWLENLGTIRGVGKPQNTFSFEEAMKVVANKPQNINATPQQLAQQARDLMAAGSLGAAPGPRVGGAVDANNPLLR
jgi:hypothetical protein